MDFIKPIARSCELLHRVKEALTPDRRSLLIAVDGVNGVGKSSLASWLAWQLGMPAVHLDLFITSLHPIQWLTADLKRVVDLRLERGRPVIVEGVLVLDALDQIRRKADFVAFVKGESTASWADQLIAYQKRRDLPDSAHFSLDGYSDENGVGAA
jgi:2-phosphoglycerate kinase